MSMSRDDFLREKCPLGSVFHDEVQVNELSCGVQESSASHVTIELTGEIYSSVPTKELEEASGSAKNTGCFDALDLRLNFGVTLIFVIFLFVFGSVVSIN